MKKLYKLTDKNRKTYGNTLWEIDVPHVVDAVNPVMCSPTVIHAYESPLLAVLLDNIHANFGYTSLLWEAEGEVVISDGLKVGCRCLTIKKQIEKPKIDDIQHVAFGILCSLEVYKEQSYIKWANNWLDNIDRSAASAASYAASSYVSSSATYATAASYAASSAASCTSSYVSSSAASCAASYAASAANAAKINKNINFIKLVEKAMNYT